MKKLFLFSMLVTALAAFGAVAAQAGAPKVDVCHIPPGNPANFHTITISEKAFSAHLAHGDLGGACDDACAALCDDGNACTIDDTADCEQVGCPTIPELVDCDDTNECTADSCDPASGCVNTARLNEPCDDGQICSGPDICDADGGCQGAAIDNCCLDDDDCSQDPCDQASCNLGTNRCGEDPVECIPPDLCTASACAPDSGACVDSAIVCDEGEECNLVTGECAPSEATSVRTVFTTSGIFTGDLATAGGGVNGLDGADNLCQAASEAGGSIVPTGEYVALLSTSAVDARDRLTANTVGYVLPDGTLIATSKADLFDGSILTRLNTDAGGFALPGGGCGIGGCVWTGSLLNGTLRPGGPDSQTCSDWTAARLPDGSQAAGGIGIKVFTDAFWINAGGPPSANPCTTPERLYCFQQ